MYTEPSLLYISTTLDIVAALFVGILLLYSFSKMERKNQGDYFFILLCSSIFVLLLFEIPQINCRGIEKAWYPVMLHISTFMLFVLAGFVPLIYTNYLSIYLGVEIKERRLIRKWMSIIGSIEVFICLLNLPLGFYYTIDPATNLYARGPLWMASQIIGLIPVVFDVVLFVRRRRFIFENAWIGTLFYVLLPIAGAFVQFRFHCNTTYFSMALAVYMLFFNIKSEQSYRMEKQQKELAESRISIMLSQIQPHFMYNSLTTIAALCEKDPIEAKKATMNFSRYLRRNIDSVNKRMPVPFQNEMEHVMTYLELEKLRFGDRLKVELDLETNDFVVPTLSIQPIVENAVKHGICNKVDGSGTVTIKSRRLANGYEVVVADDGVGFDTGKKINDGKGHIGLENVKNRLESMSSATMKVESVPGEGTKVTVFIPDAIVPIVENNA